jgi:hypothetical protein
MSATVDQVHQQITRLAETTQVIKQQRDDAQDALRDIIRGCELMQHPALTLTGAFAGFVAEVKRVAVQGLTS